MNDSRLDTTISSIKDAEKNKTNIRQIYLKAVNNNKGNFVFYLKLTKQQKSTGKFF